MIAWLLLACPPPDALPTPPETVTVTFVAMNDFHGALAERPDTDHPATLRGGLPVLVGAVDALRAEVPDLVLLDGGDCFQGDWAVNVSEGMGSVQAFDLLGVDVQAVGNHEFDYGDGPVGLPPKTGALEAAFRASPRFVSANIAQADGAPWRPEGLAPWRIIERKGVKIGVIGLTTTETPQTTLAANVSDLRFADPVQTVRDAVPQLEQAGARVIVVVGHLTGKCKPPSFYEPPGADCVPDGEIGRLLTELPPGTIDVLVAGHAHTLLANRIGDTFVLENRAQGAALGRLDLVVGPEGPRPDASTLHRPWALEHVALDPGCAGGAYPTAPIDVGGRALTPSAEAVALMTRLRSAAPDLCERVTCAEQPLTRNRDGESGLGDVVADAMLAAFPQADFAVTNAGGLRADLPAGDIAREHVHGVMPFDNRLLLVRLPDATARELFRIGSSGAHGALQVAGARYAFDPAVTVGQDRDADGQVADWERDRLCEATARGAEIGASDRVWTVVTTDFLYGGGDHLGPAFQGAEVVAEGPLLRDAILAHLRAGTGCWVDPVRPDAARVARGACAP